MTNVRETTKEIYKATAVQVSCPFSVLWLIKTQSEKYNMDWKII
jgi:hypothetical protein